MQRERVEQSETVSARKVNPRMVCLSEVNGRIGIGRGSITVKVFLFHYFLEQKTDKVASFGSISRTPIIFIFRQDDL